MDKLIELLNERIKEEGWIGELSLLDLKDKQNQIYFCSKHYGFIQRLVENDKIDFDNRELKDKFMEEFERYPTFNSNTYKRDFNENGLLMLLAISDTPIEDLISYLNL